MRFFLQYHEYCLFLLSGNMVTGDKVSLGVYQSQTDWSKEEIQLEVSYNYISLATGFVF